MQRTLEELILALRGGGLEPGLSECIDALHAVRMVGLERRDDLREALGSTLAKNEVSREIFDDVFDRFFSFSAFSNLASNDAPAATVGDTPEGLERPDDPAPAVPADGLLRMIETGDRAGLARRLRAAEKTTGLTGAWLFTQRGLYTRRIMEAMGSGLLSAEETELERNASHQAAPPAAALRLVRLRQAREVLFREVRDHVARQLALYGTAASIKLRDSALTNESMARIERRDFDRVQRLVRKLARRLAARHSLRNRRRNSGRLDVRRTLALSAPYGGLMFETRWKDRVVEKPRVIAICDVSRSVQAHARFLLLLLYSLRDVLPDLRSFAFTHRLVDVSDRFDQDAPELAIERVLDQVGGTGTNYGTMLRDFAAQELPRVDRRTSVIFLGDARNNRADPQIEVMRVLHKRARRVVWLNPEPRSFWSLGDSEMPRYAPCCHVVRECGTLAQLERAVDGLLRSTGGNG